MLGFLEWMWIAIIVLVLLGGPALARRLGRSLSELRKVTRDLRAPESETQSEIRNVEREHSEEISPLEPELAAHDLRGSSHFLTTFLEPRLVDDLPIMSSAEWQLLLGKHPSELTKEFEEKGLVVRSNLVIHLGHKFSGDELKDLLKHHNRKHHGPPLPLSGGKNELILRLIGADYEGMWEAVSGFRVLQCSERGAQIVEQYLGDISRQDEKTIAHKLKIPASKVREWIKWMLATAVAGIIGNRADDAFVRLKNLIAEPSTAHPPEPAITTPTPTPVPNPSPINASPTVPSVPDDTIDGLPTSKPKYTYRSFTTVEDVMQNVMLRTLRKSRRPPRSPYPDQPYGVIGEAVTYDLGHSGYKWSGGFSLLLDHVGFTDSILSTIFIIKCIHHYSRLCIQPFRDFRAFTENGILEPEYCPDNSPFKSEIALLREEEVKLPICWGPLDSSVITIQYTYQYSYQTESGTIHERFDPVVWRLRRVIDD